MNLSQPLIQTRDLCKTYGKGDLQVKALQDVNLSIAQGEFTALVGPSGSGKTTLLNLIGALDTPSTGSIELAGIALESLSRKDRSELRRDRIGFVFQAYNLIPVFTALENACFVLSLQDKSPAEQLARGKEVLELVGLAGLEDRTPDQLSGGQQQRVAIARALAPRPEVLLADEPSANLDSKNAISLLDQMTEINQTTGTTFIFSTHDSRVVERSRRVITLVDGAISHDSLSDSK